MAQGYRRQYVSDEDRRAFLKALGVAGTVAAGGATLDEVQSAMTTGAADELAPIGQAIAADLEGALDGTLLGARQEEIAAATAELPRVAEQEFSGIAGEPTTEFAAVAEAGRPVYDHLAAVGFFESTTEQLPRLNPEFLDSVVGTFAGSEALTGILDTFGFAGTTGVDLLAEIVANAEELRDYHWVATDELPREKFEFGEHIPPMTMGAAGGSLLWLEDLDYQLWRQSVLVTDEIVQQAIWHGQSMAAGFYLMTEGAKAIAEGSALTDEELGALLSTGFAVQAIGQGLLPQDVYWITDEMRGEGDIELETITE